ncbi:hypothetical protein [Actinomadura sp. 7K534]|nr:hypothetical protein [Actinomadura sp. 7K534]
MITLDSPRQGVPNIHVPRPERQRDGEQDVIDFPAGRAPERLAGLSQM